MPVEETATGSAGTVTETPDTGTAPESNATPSTDKETDGAEANKQTETPAKAIVKVPASIKPPTKNGRFQARISDLVAQRDQARMEGEQLRQELSRMRGMPRGKGEETPAGEAAEVGADGEIKPEDFKTYGEYITALVSKTMQQHRDAEKSKAAEEAFVRYRQEKMDDFNNRCQPLAEVYGDGFWDAITDPHLPVSEAMADAVIELGELGPFTMLWLAAHHDEATRISKLNPRQATIAIGRLAAQLDSEIKAGNTQEVTAGATEAAPTTPAQPSSAAPTRTPTPVPTPRGSAPANTLNEAPSDKDDINTWLRKETDRLRRKNPQALFYGAQ